MACALFILSLNEGEVVTGSSKCFPEPYHHPMPENPYYTADEFLDLSIEFDILVVEKPHNRLTYGHSNCFHNDSSFLSTPSIVACL